MVFAQSAADNQYAVELRDFRNRHTKPWHNGRRGAEIRLAGAKINIGAANAAHKLLQQVEFFERLVRRGQRADL